jgi:hypothetical protein
VARLKKPGDTTPLIEDESGYHIARYISERAPKNVSFEEARAGLRDTMFEPWRQARFLKFVEDLGRDHTIEAYPERLRAF